ncbi:hypothetical protein FHW67_001340 [Herbaspirillum sp. Sphag1AN]|uniref:hypothetical protein n=1 Tax=unclassified Herbaspirillum TaxID=2624150 RepID=UPI00160CAE24|nr:MULTISPECIES: hypothetical protein [unclassified Herbaspirillum]MBB3212072.1 hypothetical protein [Herbaspirillum sp. Sphag1AN]MBB3244094.1 hypothetical protein [Herbaspirillum sp. Sphag64]
MAIGINNSVTAIVPAVNGNATPVVDVGDGPGSLNALVALSDTRSVVVNLTGEPRGGVTYSASGLLSELSQTAVPSASPAEKVRSDTGSSTTAAVIPLLPGQSAAPAFPGMHISDDFYDNTGALTPSRSAPVAIPEELQVHFSGAGAGTGGAVAVSHVTAGSGVGIATKA